MLKPGVYVVRNAVQHNLWAWLTIHWCVIASAYGVPISPHRFLETDCLLVPTRPIRIVDLKEWTDG